MVESQLSSGKQWLQKLLDLMGLNAGVTTEGFEKIESSTDTHWLNIEGEYLTVEQKELLIGNKGQEIDSIQYLANTILNLNIESETQNSYTIELDGYRVKRIKELNQLTKSAIEQVRETAQELEIPGLSAAERKQVHSLLEDIPDLTSESRGHEPDRRLVLKLQ